MTTLLHRISHPAPSPTFPSPVALGLCAASFTALLIWTSVRTSFNSDSPRSIPSPASSQIPELPEDQIKSLPYPPNALPGSRHVDSPYGRTRVYEWGPENGPRILLIHGISTPSIALADLAHRLVAEGYRVLLFDLFGRGYSSAPCSQAHRYDSALYMSQILLCIQSSPVPWPSFTIIGYSLGGAIAADFTSYLPNLVEGLVLVASGGLIRTKHISWKSRILYSTAGFIPESLIKRLVTRRLWTGPQAARSIEPEPDLSAVSSNPDEPRAGGLRSHAVYTSSQLRLLPGNDYSTVSNVVDWQILHHKGFVPAFISSIRYAPIHNQHHRWKVLAENISTKAGKLREVWLVLGETDPIIIADEMVEDAKAILGDNLKLKIVKGAAHEVAIDSASEIVEIIKTLQ
ncbi:alpha/beta-hydrolase [Periconia macrospinosa]|uniref:Alpha/beta-hydrolase n=1 Tax=Periconia macrospinosa TaxID=97972 RepID=A0A2V1D6Z4_9PLEO|nr:alpha/beta-hydrolase [Periconia macrospinosa]